MNKIILGLGALCSISAFANENPGIEERVARLEKLVKEPVLLSSCFKLPAFNDAFIVRSSSYFIKLEERNGIYTYQYQQIRKLLVDGKIIQQIDNLTSPQFRSLSQRSDDVVDADLREQVANFQKDKAQFMCP